MKTLQICMLVILTSLTACAGGCAINRNTADLPREKVYNIDGSSRRLPPFVDDDDELFELRFENADIYQIVDALNRLTEKFAVIAAVNEPSKKSLTVVDDGSAPQATEKSALSGYYSGRFVEIIRDICLTGGYVFDRIENNFYIASGPIDLSLCAVSSMIETSLKSEELESLRTSFGDDVNFNLIGSKLLISGRFYAVKRFREYVLQLNEVKRCYVARLVFVRLDRQSVSRLEAELKASQLDLISSGYDLFSMFESQLDIKLSRENTYNYMEQLLYCSDGQKSTLKIGSTFQREQRAVSDYGTSTTTGYQQFEDGVDVELTPKRSLDGVVEVALKFSNSKFADTASLSKNQVDLNYDCLSLQENKLYYVASLTENNSTIGARFLGLSNSNDGKLLTCWLVISPVKAGINKTIDENI